MAEEISDAWAIPWLNLKHACDEILELFTVVAHGTILHSALLAKEASIRANCEVRKCRVVF